MPKTILDYSKTIMYKIVCNDLTIKDCYVGHTINMTKRKCGHKSCCNNEKHKAHNLKIYQIIRENGGWSNWSMLLVEKFPCKDKHEACKREREIFEGLGAIMNSFRPYRTQEEHKQYDKQYLKKYREDHKEYYKEYDKQYREEHKAELNEKKKQYCEAHKEKIEQYQKKYHEDHKEEHKQHNKKYYQEHKEEIIEKNKEKIECEFCAIQLQKSNMSRHYKTCKSKPREMNEIIEKNKEKIECEFCSKLLQKCSMSRHLKICKSKPVKND